MSKSRITIIPFIPAIVWALGPILIKILGNHFDLYTQSFYRYLAATFFLIIITSISRQSEWLSVLKKWKYFLLPAFFLFIFQILWVKGIYLSGPTLASFLNKMSVIFVAFFSFILFKDERKTIKNPSFLKGSLLAILGGLGLTLTRRSGNLEFGMGALILIGSTLFWATYVISVKTLLNQIRPLPATAVVTGMVALLFLPVVFWWGNYSQLGNTSLTVDVILFGSGILCIGIGNFTNYIAIKNFGATVPSVLLLLAPLMTAVFSYFTIKEKMSPLQIISGLLLIYGCWLILNKLLFSPEAPG